jgi:hypothetical protein
VIVAMIMSIFLSIDSMDKKITVNKQNVEDNQSLAWTIILKNGVAVFNYRRINRLAATSKKLERVICNTAQDRKEYLTKQLALSEDIYWHKHGAMAGQAVHNICPSCLPDRKISYNSGLRMNRFYLHTLYNSMQPQTVYHSGFSGCLSFLQQSFFDGKSDFCFYGYDGGRDTVTEYYIAASRKPWELPCSQLWCATDIASEKSALSGLEIFLEFPVLLSAFLRSRKVHQERLDVEDDYSTKIYAIEGVEIPKDYAVHKAYFPESKYSSFDDLPEYIRNVIVKRYKEQQVNNIEAFIISKIERSLIEREVGKRGKKEILHKIDKSCRKKTKELYDKQHDLYCTEINPCLKISCKFFQKEIASDPLTQDVFKALQPKGRGLGSNTQYSWIKEHKTKGVIKVKSLFCEKYHVLLIVENHNP